ncbi:hypothetical protein [Segatella buccae]|jgi:hypothetical protein|uniref:hypothetical protein n=1 Tax=Segatella buccae TaxID=28126 RepID=UPI000A96FBEA|nr:hypothetical protein [Segatella buccae]MBS5894306.1 hypothetical protein [Segatella buccae]
MKKIGEAGKQSFYQQSTAKLQKKYASDVFMFSFSYFCNQKQAIAPAHPAQRHRSTH